MGSCIAACEHRVDCLQLRFNGDECALGTKRVKLGELYNPKEKDKKRWQSNWNRTRIAEWASRAETLYDVGLPL
jgi:hypothetical protein